MGSIVSGLFGKGGSGVAQQGIEEAGRRAADAYFKPYTVTSGYGGTQYDDGRLASFLSGPYAQLQGQTTGVSSGLIPAAVGMALESTPQFQGYGQGLMNLAAMRSAQMPQQFGFTPDIQTRAQGIFSQQAEQLQPEFARQATELQGKLFGSGRLGLRLAGESQGLGAGGGAVQPDALGLGRAQQQTLAQLSTQARQQAFGEEAQRYEQALGGYQANQAAQQAALQNLLTAQGQGFGQAAQAYGLQTGAQQQQLANIMGLQQGLFGQAAQLAGLENQLMQLGMSAEQARSAAALGAGNLAVAPYATAAKIAQEQRGQNAGFFGGLIGAGLGAYGMMNAPAATMVKV
jgi:hypothetical protein